MARLLVTLDTNTIDHHPWIENACFGLDVELAYTTVTDRETEGTSRATSRSAVLETGVWDEPRWGQFVWGGSVKETGVYDESRYGEAVYAAQRVHESWVVEESPVGQGAAGSDASQPMLERILDVIGSGSYPARGAREILTAGRRRQLRDAMILEAHSRDRRDVLVTNNTADFVKHRKRERLEALCGTRIMTVAEFCETVADIAKPRPE